MPDYFQSICPHCQVAGVGARESLRVGDEHGDRDGRYDIESTTCPNPDCGRIVLWLVRRNGCGGIVRMDLIRPTEGVAAGSRAPAEVAAEHPEVSRDFAEATKLLNVSPMASAAMSRRCLQHLIRKKVGITRRTLKAEIDALIDTKQLPSHLEQQLDYLRQLGNTAAHPLENEVTGQLVEVDMPEAEWSIEVLKDLFDHYYVKPARGAAKLLALQKKLRGSPTAPGVDDVGT